MKFLTPLITQKHAAEPGEFILYRDFVVRHKWYTVTVPKGFITDFASVPRLAQLLPGFSKTEGSAHAAVLHDWLYCCAGNVNVRDVVFERCEQLQLSRQDCDLMLYYGLRASGYNRLSAWLFYSAVRAGGWLYWNRRRDGLDFAYDFVPDEFDWSAP